MQADFTAPSVFLAQPVLVRGDGKHLLEWSLTEAAAALIADGIATREVIDSTVAALRMLALDETTLLALPRTMQVWARK